VAQFSDTVLALTGSAGGTGSTVPIASDSLTAVGWPSVAKASPHP